MLLSSRLDKRTSQEMTGILPTPAVDRRSTAFSNFFEGVIKVATAHNFWRDLCGLAFGKTPQSPDRINKNGESSSSRSFSHHPRLHRAGHHHAQHASCSCKLRCRQPGPN